MIFETVRDRVAQKAIVAAVSATFGYRAIPMPALTPVDALFSARRRIVGACEAKRRYVRRRTYPTCWAEKAKVQALLACQCLGDGKHWYPVFAVGWDDAIGIVDATVAAEAPLVRRTLTTVRAAGDVDEWVYDVPIAAFFCWPVLMQGRLEFD